MILRVLICLAFAFSPTTVSAGDVYGGGTSWTVVFPSVPLEGEFSRSSVLVKASIYPKRLIVVGNDGFDRETGKKIVSAGDQLIEHITDVRHKDFCTTRDLGFLANGIFHCFVDQDGDGELDGYYRVLSRLLSGAPLIDSGKLAPFKPLSATQYSEGDPRHIDSPVELRILWNKGDGVSSPIQARVSVVSGTEKHLHFERQTKFVLRESRNVANVLGNLIDCQAIKKNRSNCKIVPPSTSLDMVQYGSGIRFAPTEG